MKRKKIQNIVLLVSFIVVLLFPIVTMNKVSGKISENEKRYLASFPSFVDENGDIVLTGFRSGMENWLNDNIGYRETFVKIHSNIEFNVFKDSPNEKVQIGKNGWYYYTLDNNLEIARGNYPLNDQMLLNIKKDQERIQEYYEQQGIEYVLLLAPSKVSIYPENIKSGDYSIRQTPMDVITDYLRKNTTIKVINLKDSLLKAKETDQVYYKTDTHWNQTGAYAGYKEVINKLNEFNLIDTKPVEIEKVPSLFNGEFSSMMGDAKLLGEEETIDTKIVSPKADETVEKTIGQIEASYIFNNATVEGKNVLMYGDSMFGSWNLPQLFAENFKHFTYVWTYEMSKETVDIVKPDIVIYEMAERKLSTLPGYSRELTYLNFVNPQAEIISDNTPTDIKRGKSYDIEITVKNTSEDYWSEEDLVRLCIWQDGIDCGYRVNIPDQVVIEPGQEYTFTLPNFQAPVSDTTFLEYQMVQEYNVYFGEKQRIDINVKK